MTGSSTFFIPSEWTLAKTALHNITSAVQRQPRKNDPQSAAAAAAWAQSSNPLLCRRAMSMPPLRPPRPSLTDSRSPPARCISTGEPRRYTVRVVSLKKAFLLNIRSLGVPPAARFVTCHCTIVFISATITVQLL